MTSTTMMSSATAASNHPSIAAALVDAHPRLRKNAGKCTLSLVGRNSPDYMHQWCTPLDLSFSVRVRNCVVLALLLMM
uniref:Uncharacterized protein n=1 Tax=Arundo donax TaxID=35708 RepID=A0A0A9BLF8_ARUDO